jgi:hypothetical protein
MNDVTENRSVATGAAVPDVADLAGKIPSRPAVDLVD